MDACDAISDDENGVLEKFSLTGKEGLASDTVSGALGSNIVAAKPASLESTPQLEESDAIQFSMAGTKSESIVRTESTQCASKESLMKDSDGTKHSKAQKSQGKVKNSSTANKKLTNSRNLAAASAEKVKDGNEKQEQMTAHVSNGSFSSISHSKQSLAHASNKGSSNRKQAPEGDESVDSSGATRLALAQSISLHSKPSTRTVLAASTTKVAQPDRLKEELKELKPLKQQSQNKGEEHSPSASLSPTAACPKPQRVGKIPSYSFSFKCDERAQKRKEFFSKLEEKIHAKEVEETTLQAKSKETQEAEIKLLRKSLTFKATPMPSFYQEPAPPKVELKKIPTTRAKSPKLGRQKNSPMVSAEDSNHSRGSARMSLDERRSSKTGPAKESAPDVKKPLRRSLPKLPSERSTLVDSESFKTEPPQNSPEVDPLGAEEICQTESKQDGPSVAAEVEPTEEEQSQKVQIASFASSMESVEWTI